LDCGTGIRKRHSKSLEAFQRGGLEKKGIELVAMIQTILRRTEKGKWGIHPHASG